MDAGYLTRNVRVNVAALASLALAPPAPRVTDEDGVPRLTRGASGYDAQLAWAPVTGAAGYRVFWRAAWTPDWEHEIAVGPVTETTLPGVSIDDVVVGVAAVDSHGHESLASVYVMPERNLKAIKTR